MERLKFEAMAAGGGTRELVQLLQPDRRVHSFSVVLYVLRPQEQLPIGMSEHLIHGPAVRRIQEQAVAQLTVLVRRPLSRPQRH
jgi:hypothetical protein